MATSQPIQSKPLRPLTDGAKVKAVMEAISSFDVAKSPAWKGMGALASIMRVSAVDPLPEGLFETGMGFSAVATVYAMQKDGSTSTFPAEAEGHFEDQKGTLKAVVDTFSVDPSSFYA